MTTDLSIVLLQTSKLLLLNYCFCLFICGVDYTSRGSPFSTLIRAGQLTANYVFFFLRITHIPSSHEMSLFNFFHHVAGVLMTLNFAHGFGSSVYEIRHKRDRLQRFQVDKVMCRAIDFDG